MKTRRLAERKSGRRQLLISTASVWRLGARVEFGPIDRRWTVAEYARNLTNADHVTATFGTAPTAYGGRPGPSRQFAIDFSVRR